MLSLCIDMKHLVPKEQLNFVGNSSFPETPSPCFLSVAEYRPFRANGYTVS